MGKQSRKRASLPSLPQRSLTYLIFSALLDAAVENEILRLPVEMTRASQSTLASHHVRGGRCKRALCFILLLPSAQPRAAKEESRKKNPVTPFLKPHPHLTSPHLTSLNLFSSSCQIPHTTPSQPLSPHSMSFFSRAFSPSLSYSCCLDKHLRLRQAFEKRNKTPLVLGVGPPTSFASVLPHHHTTTSVRDRKERSHHLCNAAARSCKAPPFPPPLPA